MSNIERCITGLYGFRWWIGEDQLLSQEQFIKRELDRVMAHQGNKPPSQSIAVLPRNLKRLRKEKGWTQVQLAIKANVSFRTIQDLEIVNNYDVPEAKRGGSGAPTYGPNPKLITLLAVAAALECRIEELVEERNDDRI